MIAIIKENGKEVVSVRSKDAIHVLEEMILVFKYSKGGTVKLDGGQDVTIPSATELQGMKNFTIEFKSI